MDFSFQKDADETTTHVLYDVEQNNGIHKHYQHVEHGELRD